MLPSVFLAASLALSPVDVGRMVALPSHASLLVTAPHGGFDLGTDDLAREVALLSGGGYLVATGYRTREHPWNVDRPTEGVGLAPEDERASPAAAAIFARWRSHVDAQAPRLYVEIHGNSRVESARAIEVASKGVTAADLAWLKADFASRLTAFPAGVTRLPLAAEPFDSLHYRAASNKQVGMLAYMPQALHFELPAAARMTLAARSRYAAALALSLRGLAQREGIRLEDGAWPSH